MSIATPLQSLLGGSLIGVAAVVLMFGLGRIAGMTGMLMGLLEVPQSSTFWRLAFLAGAVAAPLAASRLAGFNAPLNIEASTSLLIASGILVGVGTTLASGCTSGHGVCGLARLSKRSLVAVPTFMIATAVTVFVMRHVIGQ